MNNKIKILVMIMLILGACEDGYITDCDECYPEVPGDVYLKIHVTKDQLISTLKIYEGPIEDKRLLNEFIVYEDECEYEAMLYKDYTLSIEYLINGKKYIAIDKARPKVRKDENTCDEECYYIYDNIVDLTLKYTK